MKDRRDYLIAALAGALLLCLGVLIGHQASVLPAAHAQGGKDTRGFDPEAPLNLPGSALLPGGGSGVSITNGNGVRPGGVTGGVSTYASDSNANNRFVAVTCPIGSGESVLFVIDAKTDQLAVYQYVRRKGLRFVAGRKVDYDLKISGYQDISEFSRGEMRRLYEKELSRQAADAVKGKKK